MAPAPSRKRARPPPAVQDLLDALLHVQGHLNSAASSPDSGAAPPPPPPPDRASLLAWFEGLPVGERRRVLCIDEPAFVRLLQLMARKAHARAVKRQQQRQRQPAHGLKGADAGRAVTSARFVVFAEGLAALGAGAGNKPGAAGSAAGVGVGAAAGKRGSKKKKEAATTPSSSSSSSSWAEPGTALDVAGILGDEPFLLRPDGGGQASRTTAWGDELAPLALTAVNAEAEAAWARLAGELLLLLSPHPSSLQSAGAAPTAAVFSSAFLADAAGVVRTLEAASGGGFLRGGPVEAKECQALFGEAPWFRSRGDYSLGEVLANKAELLLCKAWHREHQDQHQHQQHQHQHQHQQHKKQSPPVPVALAAHLEEKEALGAFLFEELALEEEEEEEEEGEEEGLGTSGSNRRACVVKAFARAVKEEAGAAEGASSLARLEGMVAALGLLDQYAPLLLLPSSKAAAASPSAAEREGALEALLAWPLSRAARDGAVEQGVRRRMVLEMRERRTAWHQRQLLALVEEAGDGGEAHGGRAQPLSKTAKKKKKQQRRQQQQQQQQQRQLEEEEEGVEEEKEKGAAARDEQAEQGTLTEGGVEEQEDGKQRVSFSAADETEETVEAPAAHKARDEEQEKEGGVVVAGQGCGLRPTESPPLSACPSSPQEKGDGEEEAPAVHPRDVGADEGGGEESPPQRGEEDEEDGRSGSRRTSGEGDYWEGEDTLVGEEEGEEEEEEETTMAPTGSAAHPLLPGGVAAEAGSGSHVEAASTETLLRDMCLKLEAEVATLRGVLATQRGLVMAAAQQQHQQQQPLHSAAYPSSAYVGAGVAAAAAATVVHQGSGGYFGGSGYHHPALLHHHHQQQPHHHRQRHLSHHLEIMSDDGRGGRYPGVGWSGEGLQRSAQMHSSSSSSSFAPHPPGPRLAPPPAAVPNRGPTNTEAAAGTGSAGSVYSAEGTGGLYSRHHQQAPPPPVVVVMSPLPRSTSASQQSQASQQGWTGTVAPVGATTGSLPPTAAPTSQPHSHFQRQQQSFLLRQGPPHPGDAGQEGSTAQGLPPALALALADECSGFVLERRLPQRPVRSRLCDDVAAFAAMVGALTEAARAGQALAIPRCRQVVQSLWPRAQVKAYGSFVTGLALPSSDVDLVICLPKVRKDAPAEAPGVLEGRNAIKETWQQELARRLRAAPWVHPGSIRIIPHTAIPVIKLRALASLAQAQRGTTGTGDSGTGGTTATRHGGSSSVERLPSPVAVAGEMELTEAEQQEGLQGQRRPEEESRGAGGDGKQPEEEEVGEVGVPLDVSIEGSQHNGLVANRVIADLLRESPALRPLVLVLKQFLKERGLMESYSGGLSSYGLVLMVARYLQEQSGAPMDTGSLLLGFLDFFSNHFDPRTTGISVSRRCFFSRDHQAAAVAAQQRRGSLGGDAAPELALYAEQQQQQQQQQFGATRRHSSLVAAGADGVGVGVGGPLLENPYRFDPLYIEDPISPNGSNVGRNCFRIFQVLRAWNDAWRALDPAASAGFRHWQPVAPPASSSSGEGDGARRPHPSSLPLLGRVLCKTL